jgi:hypothetical protein
MAHDIIDPPRDDAETIVLTQFGPVGGFSARVGRQG